jgi:hypothetical protein
MDCAAAAPRAAQPQTDIRNGQIVGKAIDVDGRSMTAADRLAKGVDRADAVELRAGTKQVP